MSSNPANEVTQSPAVFGAQYNTYPLREQFRALGGAWDAERKAWIVPANRAEEAKRIANPQRYTVVEAGNEAVRTAVFVRLGQFPEFAVKRFGNGIAVPLHKKAEALRIVADVHARQLNRPPPNAEAPAPASRREAWAWATSMARAPKVGEMAYAGGNLSTKVGIVTRVLRFDGWEVGENSSSVGGPWDGGYCWRVEVEA